MPCPLPSTTHTRTTHTHTKQKRPDKTRQRRRLFKGKGGEGSVGWGGAGHSQKLVQKFMISDKSTFPPVIYSARAHLPSPFHRTTPLSVVYFPSLNFFAQCTRPFTAIVTTTPPGEKTKIQRGKKKRRNHWQFHAGPRIDGPFYALRSFHIFFSAIFRVLFSGFSLLFLFWFFGTRSPWIFAIMETNVGLLNSSIGLAKVAKAGKEIFMGLGR